MRRRARSEWVSLFLEYAIAALAEAIVAALGWVLRKLWRWWKRRNEPDDDAETPAD